MRYVFRGIFITLVASFLFSTFGFSAESKLTLSNGANNIESTTIGSELYEKWKSEALNYIEIKKDDELWV